MPITDIFSKRQKRLQGDLPDVYRYDSLPSELRVQAVHLFDDALGGVSNHGKPDEAFKIVHDVLCREYGKFSLTKKKAWDEGYRGVVVRFLLETEEVGEALDVIETTLRVVMNLHRDWSFSRVAKISVKDAVQELNYRFREHAIGFQFEDGAIVRVDSKFLHQEVVRPALGLLSDNDYQGANQEFLGAHEHYRSGRFKEAVADAAKALESVLKVIAGKKGWSINGSETLKPLLNLAFSNNLIPSYLQSEFTGLRSTLESGVPSVRNKVAGHGQGATPVSIPIHLASYVLHLTATSIVFLIEAARVTE